MKKNRLKKGIIITVSTLLVLAAGGSFGFGGFIADKILHQNADKDTHDNSIKQMEVWDYDYSAFEDSYKGTEVSATAEDGNTVPATYYSNDCDTCVILVHGAGGDRACTAPLAEGYLKRGYDVIAIDQRGCGTNPDDRVTFGINEQLDVRAMVEYARERSRMLLSKRSKIFRNRDVKKIFISLHCHSLNRLSISISINSPRHISCLRRVPSMTKPSLSSNI